jgi:hypothetical protein
MRKERKFVKTMEEQFRRMFGMWKEKTKNIPVKDWRRGGIDYLVPARHVCNLIVTADYYLGDKSREEYDWNCCIFSDTLSTTSESRGAAAQRGPGGGNLRGLSPVFISRIS